MKTCSVILLNRSIEISALSSGKIDKCENLTGEEILPWDQRRLIEQTELIYSPIGKAFEKQIRRKTNKGASRA